jgi:hypothetical protein
MDEISGAINKKRNCITVLSLLKLENKTKYHISRSLNSFQDKNSGLYQGRTMVMYTPHFIERPVPMQDNGYVYTTFY